MKRWPFSFSELFDRVARGGVEARTRLIDLARLRPRDVLPYVRDVAALLDSTRGPVQKASLETLAALSHIAPSAMAFLLPKLHSLLANEPQNAIANHAIEILANYGKTSAYAAKKVIPIFRTTVSQLGPKSAVRVRSILKEITE